MSVEPEDCGLVLLILWKLACSTGQPVKSLCLQPEAAAHDFVLSRVFLIERATRHDFLPCLSMLGFARSLLHDVFSSTQNA